MGGSRFHQRRWCELCSALKLQTYQLKSYHTPPEIAYFWFLVIEDDACSVNAFKSELISVLRMGGIEGVQGAPIPYQGTLYKMINIYKFIMALFSNFRAGGTLEMYEGLEMSGLNGGRAHNHNELQLITKITQFRKEYDNFTVDKFAVLRLEPGSHQRPWRINGEISSLSLLRFA